MIYGNLFTSNGRKSNIWNKRARHFSQLRRYGGIGVQNSITKIAFSDEPRLLNEAGVHFRHTANGWIELRIDRLI